MITKEEIAKELKEDDFSEEDMEGKHRLVLFNDDYNTFDFVINSLVEVCYHDIHQAEQCTYIIHYKGKCDVKKGSYNFLKPMKEQLIEKGLSAEIH